MSLFNLFKRNNAWDDFSCFITPEGLAARLTFTPYNFEGKNFDWRTKLLNLKGDGDYRYFVIADYHTGTAEGDMKGYIIDVKDNFKRIATIPIGEAFNLPYTNPKLDFTLL